ncbi:hypothetical protein ACX6XY_19960 [Streptomyces sp. O3]
MKGSRTGRRASALAVTAIALGGFVLGAAGSAAAAADGKLESGEFGLYYNWTDHYQEGTRGSLPAGYSGDASSTFKNKISSSSFVIF